MPSAVTSILRKVARGPRATLNVLTAPTHERYETNLCRTGHRFWAVRGPQVKDWDRTYAPVPANYALLNPQRGDAQLPPDVDFDLVLSQNKAGQFQILSGLARSLGLPLLSLEHTLPHPQWSPGRLRALKSLRGDFNVFISEYSRAAWGWGDDEASVIRHGVDTEVFSPGEAAKSHEILSVSNDLRNRNWCCGYDWWVEAVSGLRWKHLGKSPDGWSLPAKDVDDLVAHYRSCPVFIDPASFSPIPTVLLEAMACGAVVCSRGNALVKEVVVDGVNGYIREDAGDMRKLLKSILDDPGRHAHLGVEARRTVVEKFSLEAFVSNWDAALRRAAA